MWGVFAIEKDETENINLSYKGLLLRQIDRIGELSCNTGLMGDRKEEILEWAIQVLECFIAEELVEPISLNIQAQKKAISKLASEGKPTANLYKELLKMYISHLGKSGELYEKEETGLVR